MNEDDFPQMTEFDRMVSPEPLQIMKAMIPYTAPREQRMLSILTKVLELRNTFRTFQGSAPDVSICSAPEMPERGNPMDMLAGIRRYCSPATRQRMDECINMLSILQMAEMLQDDTDIPEGGE